MATAEQIIATINPDLYYSPAGDEEAKEINLKKFKKMIETDGFQAAAKKASVKPVSEGGANMGHLIRYTSSTEQLEPLYFWILDFMTDRLDLKVEKLVDNFTSSPGSGHFSELGGKATAMQQQGTKLLADINTVLRSVINIIYDLKEFKIRLSQYDGLKSKDNATRDAAKLALKQIWMDKVDMLKGAGSINAMASGQLGFQTLRDAFLAVGDEKAVDKVDLNDRVKRILKPRIYEFNSWIKESEQELRKRYEMERNYLASQVNSLKIYSRWVKPYMTAAAQLEQTNVGKNPAVVKAFNTIYLQLTLLGTQKVTPGEEYGMDKDIKKKIKRDYYLCVLVDFKFRGIPQKIVQRGDYVFGGKTDISFKPFALNEDELKKLHKELDKSNLGEMFSLIEGATQDSIKQIQKEIDYFLAEKEDEEKKEKPKKDDSNPFFAMFGAYNEKEKKKDNKSKDDDRIRPDNWFEANQMRRYAMDQAVRRCYKIFEVYKKVHGMPAFDAHPPFDN